MSYPLTQTLHLYRVVIIFGAISGLIATWSISTAIAASEIELALPISTFYSVLGLALGFNNVITAAYAGFGLHLLTGMILGSIISVLVVRFKKTTLMNPYKGMIVGIGAGIAIWLVFFLPITALLIQPSLDRIVMLSAIGTQKPILSDNISKDITGIAISAIVFHIIWGAIFGFVSSSLLRIKAAKGKGKIQGQLQ